MDQKAAALFALADCFASVSGNVHTLHLNVVGNDFDTMHAKVLKTYYEQLDEDYDSAAEWGRCFGDFAPNKNDSATRIGFKSIEGNAITREECVVVCNQYFNGLLEQMHNMFNIFDEESTKCPICTGVTNWLQTRIEYWAKEIAFFNKARGGII